MNASDIIRLLSTNHYAPAELDEVNKLCKDFPEFTAAHILKVRIMEALGYEKQKDLKLAAVYSMNRKKLMELVSDLRHASEAEPPVDSEETIDPVEIIQFSEESNQDADIIIEQHAPYAGVVSDPDLLELEEESGEESVEGTSGEPVQESTEGFMKESAEVMPPDGADEETDSDQLLSALVKDETEMEEPETTDGELPSIDRLDEDQENSNDHLIRKFIKGDPGPIRADRETELKGDVSLSSIREHDGFITDTLAQIYVKQGLYAKAIYAYEKLSLKYPEKSAYFAAQIEKIRNINHS
jgi:hypothetical protein